MEERIKQILADHIGAEPEDIENDALLTEDLNLNPAAMTDILEEIRDQLNIEIPYEDVANISTVGELIELYEEYARDEA